MQVQCPTAYEYLTGKVNLPAGGVKIKEGVATMRLARAAGVWAMFEKESLVLEGVVGVTLTTTLQSYVLDSLRISEGEE